MDIERLTDLIIGCCIQVHRQLGPGLLESAYQACVAHELRKRGVKIERERKLPIIYDGLELDCAYRLDIVAENAVIIEIKAVQQLHPIHEAQMITYLKLSGMSVGLLINFNEKLLKNGIRRFVNGYPEVARRSRRLGGE